MGTHGTGELFKQLTEQKEAPAVHVKLEFGCKMTSRTWRHQPLNGRLEPILCTVWLVTVLSGLTEFLLNVQEFAARSLIIKIHISSHRAHGYPWNWWTVLKTIDRGKGRTASARSLPTIMHNSSHIARGYIGPVELVNCCAIGRHW